jgi:hypothetical protein
MKSVDTQAFWDSVTMGLTAQEYVDTMLAKVRFVKECLARRKTDPPSPSSKMLKTHTPTASKIQPPRTYPHDELEPIPTFHIPEFDPFDGW